VGCNKSILIYARKKLIIYTKMYADKWTKLKYFIRYVWDQHLLDGCLVLLTVMIYIFEKVKS